HYPHFSPSPAPHLAPHPFPTRRSSDLFGQSLLDQPDAFHRLDRSADIVFIPGGAREDQGIENDVLRSEPVFFRQQLVGTLGNRELPLARKRLGLQLVLIDAADHYGSSELMSNRHEAFEFFLAVLEVDGIDDGFALAIGQRQLNRRRVGRIDHQRRFYFADQFSIARRDLVLLVSLRALQAYIHDLRPAAHLPPRNFAGFLPLFFRHQVFE